jgi:hypothetical protein
MAIRLGKVKIQKKDVRARMPSGSDILYVFTCVRAVMSDGQLTIDLMLPKRLTHEVDVGVIILGQEDPDRPVIQLVPPAA